MKKVAVLGSTGSIGTQTLDVVRANADLEIVGLAAGSNVEMLEKQIREFHPKLVAVWKEEAARDLAVRVQDLNVKIVSQMGGLIELARMEESDVLVTAIVGMIGIRPTMEAILAGKDIALANKETLVTAGHLIMPLAKQFGVQILPVDSEHIYKHDQYKPKNDSQYSISLEIKQYCQIIKYCTCISCCCQQINFVILYLHYFV